MKISPLRLAPCTDRRKPISDLDPARWIYPALPNGWKLYSFHFSIRWIPRPPTVNGPFLMCRLVELGPGEIPCTAMEQQILTMFTESEHHSYFLGLRSVSACYQRDLEAVLLPESDRLKVTLETYLWKISADIGGNLHVESLQIKEFQKWTQQLRGQAAGTPKRLIYGTSAVECHLATTGNIFPGDMDAVLVDESGRIRNLIEFKKHTQEGPIDNYLVHKYYPNNDKRKYESLQALVHDVNRQQPPEVRLTIFYYTTRTPLEIRLQEISHIDSQKIHLSRDSKTQRIDKFAKDELPVRIINWMNRKRY